MHGHGSRANAPAFDAAGSGREVADHASGRVLPRGVSNSRQLSSDSRRLGFDSPRTGPIQLESVPRLDFFPLELLATESSMEPTKKLELGTLGKKISEEAVLDSFDARK
nr:hypothetical protein CFP56_12428 [Quercus suber]